VSCENHGEKGRRITIDGPEGKIGKSPRRQEIGGEMKQSDHAITSGQAQEPEHGEMRSGWGSIIWVSRREVRSDRPNRWKDVIQGMQETKKYLHISRLVTEKTPSTWDGLTISHVGG